MLGTIAIPMLLAPTTLASASDFVVPSGTTFVYDTTAMGPLVADNVLIQAGGTLRAVGTHPFKVLATGEIRIDGTVELSGFDGNGVVTLNTTNIPEVGASGGPAGGRGGTGSPMTTASSPMGGKGFGPLPFTGGGGGESTWHPTQQSVDVRRGSGGGGGAFAANQPMHANPEDPSNLGLIAQDGRTGSTSGFGAVTGQLGSKGGRAGLPVFRDADPTNDFFGVKLDTSSGTIIVGELPVPLGGSGGGGGGDGSFTAGQGFPKVPFDPAGDEKGAGGGGGGGLGVFIASEVIVGAQGRLRCDGGHGGGGENTLFLNRVGGGSGGGSGGMVLIQADQIDLSSAPDAAITARGGHRGAGKSDVWQSRAFGQGGHGGPGLVQLHVDDASQILLPAGKTLADLASPTPHVLLPQMGL